tara:strand:+ start:265 stop:426 length:162 start_codon:yes stop_codon:yes gene_type:complete
MWLSLGYTIPQQRVFAKQNVDTNKYLALESDLEDLIQLENGGFILLQNQKDLK